jgi:hypothetical protein
MRLDASLMARAMRLKRRLGQANRRAVSVRQMLEFGVTCHASLPPEPCPVILPNTDNSVTDATIDKPLPSDVSILPRSVGIKPLIRFILHFK